MQTLAFYSHILLNSRYRPVLYLLFYIIILLSYNNTISYVYCMEENQNLTSNKYFGMTLFVGSIVLMFFLQNFTGGSDPSTIIDMTMQLHNQGTLQNAPEFLDSFTLTKDGKIYINDLNIDTKSLYLNADEVIRQIQLDDKYKLILTDTYNRLHAFYSKYNIPIQDAGNLEQILPAHLEHLNNMINSCGQITLVSNYFTNFIEALEKTGILHSNYILLLNEFITHGGHPDHFYNFLVSKLQQRPTP